MNAIKYRPKGKILATSVRRKKSGRFEFLEIHKKRLFVGEKKKDWVIS